MKALSTIELLLELLDQGYDKKSWHGPNLKGSIRRVDADLAGFRPRGGRHSIADIALHCAYWKYAARRRLRADKRGSFAFKGSNWFTLPEPLDEACWREIRAVLDAEHKRLRAAVLDLPPRQLDVVPAGATITNRTLIQSMAFHDVYHAGQIRVLKGGLSAFG